MSDYLPYQQPDMPAPESEPSTSADRWALIALTVSLTVILVMCIPGFSCLAPLVVGIIALTQVKNAANPARARTYGWIAIGVGSLILIGVAVLVTLYGAVIIAAINESQRLR